MKNRDGGNAFLIAAFLIPVSVLFAAFFLYPFAFTLFTSLTRWRGIGSMRFIGPGNFVRLFTDPTFLLAVRNNLIWALASGFIQVPLAALVAIFLARRPRGWKVLRTVYFLPNVISTVALAMVWSALYNPQYGFFNGLLRMAGFEARNFLGDPSTALVSVILSSVLYIGYFMIILLAAAMNIPQELYEAAEMDGANAFQQEFLITVPMLRGTLVTSITLAMAYGMRHFEATFLMTGGGPAFSTTTIGIDLFMKMDALRYSEASAAGVILIVLGTMVIVLMRKVLGNKDPMSE
ncbi:MAG TPA: sugar ABC transporter permease, partial [Magnetospirillaceae bacterium]|nr:sugar ABC transporter permease [Magnetospirillaceae bacterium]